MLLKLHGKPYDVSDRQRAGESQCDLNTGLRKTGSGCNAESSALRIASSPQQPPLNSVARRHIVHNGRTADKGNTSVPRSETSRVIIKPRVGIRQMPRLLRVFSVLDGMWQRSEDSRSTLRQRGRPTDRRKLVRRTETPHDRILRHGFVRSDVVLHQLVRRGVQKSCGVLRNC
jgi:hypothetical protein